MKKKHGGILSGSRGERVPYSEPSAGKTEVITEGEQFGFDITENILLNEYGHYLYFVSVDGALFYVCSVIVAIMAADNYYLNLQIMFSINQLIV